MTLARTKLVPFALGGKVGSAELNAIDQNIEGALDKRAAQTDTLESLVTLTGAGRFVQPPTAGTNADTTYFATSAVRTILVTSLITADRSYTLSNTGAEDGDRILIYCEPTYTHDLTVKNSGGTTLYTLGYTNNSESPWAEFIFHSSLWKLLASSHAYERTQLFTSGGTLVAPPHVTTMSFEGVGGGGGGGGGGGSSTGNVGAGGAGGGGAQRVKVTVTVVPGETITVVVGTAGTGGAGGLTNADAVGAGGAGGDTTVTGSTSGLLATFRGAAGGVGGRIFGAGTTYSYGGQPCAHNPGASAVFTANTTTFHPPEAGPGCGGSQLHNGAIGEMFSDGGSTAYALGGLGGNVGGNQTTSCGGGASEWPGGVGAAGVTIAATANTTGTAGNNGTLGSGGSGGAGAPNNIGATAHIGGAGGTGGTGVCLASWTR